MLYIYVCMQMHAMCAHVDTGDMHKYVTLKHTQGIKKENIRAQRVE